ncbi:DUF1654 domain-containing protein [Pseudomonas hunanensis]|uniref:DUF1654 domain-containing protein n=1 Tax=Pseudomonas hunanensis TaxID=1247546 RepID=UPI00221FDDFB|nr:hypothetical protein DBADOPDK_03397 [Pseudomonas sp. MM223]CAI3804374.1 hypothetical protein GLGCALEP_03472 [Pseudomonas sp. MM221]
MAKQQSKSKAPTPPTPYEMMGARIQKIINSPAAQKARSVVIEKAHSEAQEDWERFLDEVAENDNVTVAPRDEGSARLSWTVPAED